jgi:hypothetical protein
MDQGRLPALAKLRALLEAPSKPSGDPVGSFDKHMQYMHENIDLKNRIAELETAQPQGEPVTMDGKTTIRQFVANSVPEDQIGDDWTKGYEECKRRIHRMFQQPVNAEQPAPVAVEQYQNKINHLKQLLRNVRATLHFSPEDVLAIDAVLREDQDVCSKINQCDGCQAGIPLINGTHRMGEPDGYANKIKCTADLYK